MRQCRAMLGESGYTSRLNPPVSRPGSLTTPWFGIGGCTPETRAWLHRLAGLIAVVEGSILPLVKDRLGQQIAVWLARCPAVPCAAGASRQAAARSLRDSQPDFFWSLS